MVPIEVEKVQQVIDEMTDKDLYIHLETTNGVYTKKTSGAYIRNGRIRYSIGRVKGNGPYRVGLKLDHGWVYAEGLTDWEKDDEGRLLLAGHDEDGKLAVALQLSRKPF